MTVVPKLADPEALPTYDIPCAGGFFLNSAPKSGTHLLLRILRDGFVSRSAHVIDPWATIHSVDDPAFDDLAYKCIIGHAPFTPRAWNRFGGMRQVLLLRDPVDTVLSHARYFASDHMVARGDPLALLIEEKHPSISVILRWLCLGYRINDDYQPPVLDEWLRIAAWAGLPGVITTTFSDLRAAAASPSSSRKWLSRLLAHGGIDIDAFPDWRERLTEAVKPTESRTHRDNLVLTIESAEPTAEDLRFLRFACREATSVYLNICASE